jgi:hypothetical protein
MWFYSIYILHLGKDRKYATAIVRATYATVIELTTRTENTGHNFYSSPGLI